MNPKTPAPLIDEDEPPFPAVSPDTGTTPSYPPHPDPIQDLDPSE